MAPPKKQKTAASATSATPNGDPESTNGRRKKIRNFKLFNNLPIEVRWRIYKYASYPHRVIRASWKTLTIGDRYVQCYKLESGPVPTVLHLDKEARNEALTKYFYKVPSTIFMNSWPLIITESKKFIYLNEEDIIYFITYCTTTGLLSTLRKLAKHIPLTNLVFKADLMGKFISEKDHVLPSLPTKKGLPNAVLFDLIMEHPHLRTIDFVHDKSKFDENPRPWTYQTFSFPRCASPEAIFGPHKAPWYWTTLPHVWRLVEETDCDSWRDRKKWRGFLEKYPGWTPPRLGLLGIRRCVKGARESFRR
ncbi:hypothetical protein HYFRA_00006048 [Hymenoscyphus fraxineus]|uniref:2EXR domain-containing protein n=1 Tax=Hymenoscyphus fraxineus TaxID=746836 RepID=A0A9N9KWL4_9HELO|nr:hypothetical protein HYFRA_00006048 [Hymenoscyphus fraxineus]